MTRESDRRTTPRAYRVHVLIGVAHIAAYLIASFVVGILYGHPLWAEGGRWIMFTHTNKIATEVRGEALVDGSWAPFDPEALFTTHWGSGPRYARIYNHEPSMQVVAASTCRRHPGHPDAVRYWLDIWDKQLGSLEPAGEIRHARILEWPCERTLTLPDGRTLP